MKSNYLDQKNFKKIIINKKNKKLSSLQINCVLIRKKFIYFNGYITNKIGSLNSKENFVIFLKKLILRKNIDISFKNKKNNC